MMAGRLPIRGLIVGLTVLALLGGCAAGASPTPAAASFGPVTVVTGIDSCTGVNWAWTTDPDGTLHLRDLPIQCTDKTDDPRVSGSHTAVVSMDVWGSLDNGAGVQWATVRLENAGGAWEGRQSGVASLPGRGDTIVFWYKGTGGYAGLSYFELVTGSEPWKIRGQIFPGDPPPPYSGEATGIARQEASGPAPDDAVAVVTGTGTCPDASLAWTNDPDGTKHVRDGTFRCTVTTDDPRVSGTETAPWNMDLWGTDDNGALVQWGTARLENAGGAWEGNGSGVASLPGRGDTIAFWYTGTGGYAGLSYFELWTGSDPWTIQGQIFPGNPPTP